MCPIDLIHLYIVVIAKTSITSHKDHFLFVVGSMNTVTLSNFEVCSVEYSVAHNNYAVHYISRIYLATSCRFVPLNYISPDLSSPAASTHHSSLCFHEFDFLDSTCR